MLKTGIVHGSAIILDADKSNVLNDCFDVDEAQHTARSMKYVAKCHVYAFREGKQFGGWMLVCSYAYGHKVQARSTAA